MSTKTTFFKKAIIAMFCFVPAFMFGQIKIDSEAGLRAIAEDLMGDYELTADITLTEDWVPIGDEENRFMGTINGNGKTIKGLHFIDSSRNGAGFIGVAEGAVIENLRIEGAKIYGGQDVGGIVGRAYAPTTVLECYTSGVFSGYDHIGGIIGGSRSSDPVGEYSLIENCFSTAMVFSTSWQAAGIIGTSVDMDVFDVYFAGSAYCPSGRTGGIVALPDGGSTIVERSVVMSPLIAGDEANKIIGSEGDFSVSLDYNYSWENTLVYRKGELYEDGLSDMQGVDGEFVSEATLKSADFYLNTLGWSEYAWQFVDGKYPLLAGQTYPLNADAIYVASFPERALPGSEFETNAISALGREITFTSSNTNVATIDDEGAVAFLDNGTTTLTFVTAGDDFSEGVTYAYELEVKGISYNISNEEDLRNIKYDLEGEYTLANDITLTEEWIPLGTFKGKLNGNGKVIYGLYVDDKNTRNRGLFSETEGAEITKLGIEQAYFVGNEDVGAIVGNMKGGLIDQCYVANSYISGRDHIGSIVGAMRSYEVITDEGDPDNGIPETREKRYATVSNCHSGAEIYSREFQSGGIAGIINGGTLERCYFSGQVQAQKGRVGGIVSLVDSNDPGQIRNNINLAVAGYCPEATYRIANWGGRVPTPENDYVKFINNWSKEQSYFGSDLKNSAVKDNQNDSESQEGKTINNENDARSQSFYTSTLDWDFDNIWKFMPGTEGKMYPVLQWQEAPLVSTVYGIPNPAYLTWFHGSMEAIELNKIIATYGQTLDLVVTEGASLVDKEGSYLYVTETTIEDGGWVKVALNMDAAVAGVVEMTQSDIDIEVIMRDAYSDISSVEEFLNINNRLFGKFRLTQDINMEGVEFEGFGSLETPFSGELNGNGYSIINPVVTTNGDNTKGLFNATNGAIIQKLGVVNFLFSGSSTNSGSADLGGLAGSCKNTTIDQCYVTGTIIGRDHVGGLIGGNCDQVVVTNTYVDVTVNAGSQAGGLFGVTAGTVTIENCYFAGDVNVTGRGWAGGMIGLIDGKGDIRISNCVSLGNISCVEYAAEFIGGNIEDSGVPRGTILVFKDNVYNYDAFIETRDEGWAVIDEYGDITFPVGKSANAMLEEATYTELGWDFAEIWSIEEGVAYPKLKQVPELTSVPTVSQKSNKYSVYTRDEGVYVSGIETLAEVAIYSVSGQKVSQHTVGDNTRIPLSIKGLFILHIVENGQSTSVKIINN